MRAMGETDEAEVGPELGGAISVLRRGLAESPELKAGLGYTLALALALAGGKLLVPVLIQQVLDHGIRAGFRARFVYSACAASAALIVALYFIGCFTYRRLVRAAERALAGLRVKVFAHIHRLSIAEQTTERRGAFVARVTADVDTMAQFLDWGGISWITNPALMAATLVVMLIYSWQLTLVCLVVILPLFPLLRTMQKGLLSSYDEVRTRVGQTMSEVSESVMGAAVVRAYGLEERMDRGLKTAIRRQYKAQMGTARYQSLIFPMSDFFGTAGMAAALVVGASFGPGLGLSVGKLVAFLFLVNMFLQPLAELSESFDHTQMAVAGFRKVLAVLDLPVEVVEPRPGRELAGGALSVRVEKLKYGYLDDNPVLRGLDLDVPAGTHLAIVGETGSGKTTFAKLLCRLADPLAGRILIGGVDLREVAPDGRRRAIRMVPQDGFLFDTTVRENVRQGREGADDQEVESAFTALGLDWWVASLPQGLETKVGERGESLSVGERQLVALVRAQLAGPGLLILDEATSNVDPETERALEAAMSRLSEGRTTIAIAHRLSTAEAADVVLVFDRGRIVERGTHAELVAAGGVYASLYQSWLGNTRAA